MDVGGGENIEANQNENMVDHNNNDNDNDDNENHEEEAMHRNDDDGNGDGDGDDGDDADDDSVNNENIMDVDVIENNNNIIDGGVATDKLPHERSTDCAMVLYIECDESLSPSIPANSTISIGLDKTTPLSAVFERFCVFVGSYKCARLNLEMSDFEFVHCSILNPSDTVETAALMKDDRIKAQRNQKEDRKMEAEWTKETRDSDRLYFQQMRTLLPDLNPSPLKSDVLFHCEGKIKDEQGYKQEVLSPFVRGHSSMITKRCSWLAEKIEAAKDSNDHQMHHHHHHPPQHNEDNQNVFPMYDNNDTNHHNNINNHDNNNAVPIPETDGAYPSFRLGRLSGINIDKSGNTANEVEDDHDDDHDDENENDANLVSNSRNISVDDCFGFDNNGNVRSASPVIPFFGTNHNNIPKVTLMHPPEAVKLLLEYCYTNRVIPLGYEAFQMAYTPVEESKVQKEMRDLTGPVEPFAKSSWPNHGIPTVNLSVALAGIKIAEEACLPRLSLMCEIASSQLVTSTSLLEALALCEEQHRRTGNQLLHLRKAVMLNHILGNGPRGVNDLSSMPSFQRTLKDRSDVVVPSLMMGVFEAIKHELGTEDSDIRTESDSIKAQRIKSTTHYYTKLDEDDRMKRECERSRRRKERWNKRSRKSFDPLNPYQIEKKEVYALFDLKDEDLTEIEERGHDGCGFICEEFLAELLSCNRTQEKVIDIHIRIYAPKRGIFKGVLAKKKMTNGNKIELPSSMKKVPPSKTGTKDPLLFINRVGIDPSKTSQILSRLHCIDKEGDGGPKNESPKKLTDMIERLWIGLGVPTDTAIDYRKRSRDWINVNHAYVRGIADPTGKIPPGHVYVTGIKNQDTRDLIEKNQIFMTRIPSMKCSQATMVRVITKKPKGMTDSEFEWLEELPFGAIIFGFPSEGKLPIPEVIGGDLDGDRYFLCWDKVILSCLKKMKRYMEIDDPEAKLDKPSNVHSTYNGNWVSDAQAHIESVEEMEKKALIGKLYTRSKAYAMADKERGVSNPNAEAFADAYLKALDNVEHGCKIVLPPHLHAEVKPKKFQKYLTVPEEDEFTDEGKSLTAWKFDGIDIASIGTFQ